MKKVVLIFILSILFIGVKVNAASYSMTLNTDSTEIQKDTNVDIYIKLNNINGITEGLNVCELKLAYDNTKVTINSIKGENDWNVTEGEKIILDSSTSVKTESNIAKINAKILDSTTITINNISCTDGINEYQTTSNTLNITMKQTDNIIEDTNVEVDNKEYQSSNTVENEKLGITELSITFILIAIISLFLKRIISKKDLFRKI